MTCSSTSKNDSKKLNLSISTGGPGFRYVTGPIIPADLDILGCNIFYGKRWLLVRNTEEMRVEVVEITGDIAARVATPRIGLGVEPTVQKVQGLIRVDNVAEGAAVNSVASVADRPRRKAARRAWRALAHFGALCLLFGTRGFGVGRTRNGRRVMAGKMRRSRRPQRFPHAEIFNLRIFLFDTYLHRPTAQSLHSHLLLDRKEVSLRRLTTGWCMCWRRRHALR